MARPALERRDVALLEGKPPVVGGRVQNHSKAREPRDTPDVERLAVPLLLAQPSPAVARARGRQILAARRSGVRARGVQPADELGAPSAQACGQVASRQAQMHARANAHPPILAGGELARPAR